MIVLGVDGSLQSTGLAVVETDGLPGRERVIGTGCKRTNPGDGNDNARCTAIARACVALARRYRVTLVGIELPYVAQNPDTALRLKMLGALIENALTVAGFEVVFVQASSAATALGVPGNWKRADRKLGMKQSVRERYGLYLEEDEADAVGVALAAVTKQRKQEQECAQLGLGIKPGRRRRKAVAA